MATIKYLLQGKSDWESIYLRLSVGHKNVFKRKTGLSINPKDWSEKKCLPIDRDVELKDLKSDLNKLRTHITDKYTETYKRGKIIDSNWLKNQIELFFNRPIESEINGLVEYFDYYIKNIPNKVKDDGTLLSPKTVKKYTTIKNKVTAFEKQQKKKFYLTDVDIKFINEFTDYLLNQEKLSRNTIGRYITFLKTVCRDARLNGHQTNDLLDKIKGYRVKSEFVILAFDELEKIENAHISTDYLNNARDWLIIGCYVGQRVSDLLKLEKSMVKTLDGLEVISITQQKTREQVVIPLHDKVKEILLKRDGEFPRRISDQNFNLYIKKVTEIAELNEEVEGNLINPETRRKEAGKYKKWQLVSSHICRRSFASNFYADIPTPLLMSVTGHSTEKQFLEYIGKPPIDTAAQLHHYWTMLAKEQPKKTQLSTLRKAN